MIIQHNIMALNAHRQLGGNNTMVSKNLEKLSSGFKINRAGDDAAGLAISEKMRAQITGLTRAQANAQDGISLVQTAEGALTEVHSMLNRMVDLATQASNGTIKSDDRNKVQDEMDALVEEIDRISQSTNFNGINLLDGSLGGGTTGVKGKATAVDAAAKNSITKAIEFEVSGMEDGKTVKIQLVHGGTGADGIASDANGNLTVSIKGAADRKFTQADMDTLIKNANLPESAKGLKIKLSETMVVSSTAADANTDILGGAMTVSRAKYATAKGVEVTNTSTAKTNIVFEATKAGANTSTLTATNTAGSAEGATAAIDGSVSLNLSADNTYTAEQINSLLAEAGAEMRVSYDGALKGSQFLTGDAAGAATYQLGTDGTAGAGLKSGGGLELQIGDTAEAFNKVSVAVDDMGARGLGISSLSVADQAVASKSIGIIKAAINKVSENRSAMGALQNRLEHTISNLSVSTENLTAAESRIRDVDMAKEMMHFTKNNVLSQAAQAMLAQANQQPQQVLQLLR